MTKINPLGAPLTPEGSPTGSFVKADPIRICDRLSEMGDTGTEQTSWFECAINTLFAPLTWIVHCIQWLFGFGKYNGRLRTLEPTTIFWQGLQGIVGNLDSFLTTQLKNHWNVEFPLPNDENGKLGLLFYMLIYWETENSYYRLDPYEDPSPFSRLGSSDYDDLIPTLLRMTRPSAELFTQYFGKTPLHICRIPRRIGELLKIYPEYINAQDVLGNSPLHDCLGGEKTFKESAPLLLKAGADINLKNLDGNTPLHCLSLIPRAAHSPDLFHCTYKADLTIENNSGRTVLQNLCDPQNSSLSNDDRAFILSLCIEGRDPKIFDSIQVGAQKYSIVEIMAQLGSVRLYYTLKKFLPDSVNPRALLENVDLWANFNESMTDLIAAIRCDDEKIPELDWNSLSPGVQQLRYTVNRDLDGFLQTQLDTNWKSRSPLPGELSDKLALVLYMLVYWENRNVDTETGSTIPFQYSIIIKTLSRELSHGMNKDLLPGYFGEDTLLHICNSQETCETILNAFPNLLEALDSQGRTPRQKFESLEQTDEVKAILDKIVQKEKEIEIRFKKFEEEHPI